MKKVVVLTGATGAGKTDLSLKIASFMTAEIINCDASQVRRELNIGTAKTDYRHQSIPHHLFDIIGPCDKYSAADYQKDCRKTIDEVISRGHMPFLVGGTGLYISSALYSYDFSSHERDPQFSLTLEEKSDDELFNMLKKYYPEEEIEKDKHNRRRIIRLLEKASLGEGLPPKKELLYDALVFMLTMDRNILYDRINQRTQMMIDAGWCQEVHDLEQQGIDVNHIPEIGYPEIAAVNHNQLSLAEAIDIIQKETRHYAKRQETWFKNQLHAIPLIKDGCEEEKMKEMIEQWLQK